MKLIFERSVSGRQCTPPPACDVPEWTVPEKYRREEKPDLRHGALIVQGIATSIDALSVGFAIADYTTIMAVVCAVIIAVVTFAICMAGLAIGKRFGTVLAGKATIFGGIILILIGIEIFVTSFF